MGAYAEYVAVKAAAIARKPSNLSFEEAASVPVASQTAWQGIFTHGHLEKGQTILIHGGAGAVGAYAVQLASHAASLMDMDFAVRCPLVRRWRLIPGVCPSTRTFASRFLHTPPRDDSPCVWLTLHLHQVGWRTFTSKLLSIAQHTTKPHCGERFA